MVSQWHSCIYDERKVYMTVVNIGEKIRKLRKEKGISQDTLAQYLGVSFQAVSKWENGVSHS